MRHKLISKKEIDHPFELLHIELLPENDNDKAIIKNHTEEIENYLTFNLNVVDLIEDKCPYFIIKTVKANIGIGQ